MAGGFSSGSSSSSSFGGLPLGEFGYAPIIGYSQFTPQGSGFAPFDTSGISGNPNPFPIRGVSAADIYLGRAGGAAGALQGFAGGFDPAAFGQGGAQDAGSLRALAGRSGDMFNYNTPYAKQALRQSFDPQNAFRQQNLDDLLEQSRLGQSVRGVAMTPYGAGAEANAVGRFLNDWRDRQINRMNVGSQTASTLQQPILGARQLAGSLYGQAGQLSQNAVSQMLQAYGLKGDMLSKASQSLLGILDALKISQSSSSSSSRSEQG